MEQQAFDRCYRIGQKKPVTIHRLYIKDTVEERLIALQVGAAETWRRDARGCARRARRARRVAPAEHGPGRLLCCLPAYMHFLCL